MISLTPRQKDVYEFLRAYVAEHGIAPTTEEITNGVGLASKSGVCRLLDGLEERGFIRRIPNRARAIEILGEHGAEFHLRRLVQEILAAGSINSINEIVLDAREFLERQQ